MHRARPALTVLPAVSVACAAALLLGGCTIGDVSNDTDDVSSPADQDMPSDKPLPDDGTPAPDMEAEPEPGAEDEESGEPADTDPNSPGARGLSVGDCVADLDQLSGDGEIDLVDCGEPYAGVVYAQADITGKTLFPGNRPMGQEAGDICGGENFTAYVGLGFGGVLARRHHDDAVQGQLGTGRPDGDLRAHRPGRRGDQRTSRAVLAVNRN